MKKLLLVAVSVGVFLLVTITVAIIVLTPKTQENAFSSSVPYSHGRPQPVPDIMTNMPPQTAVIGTQEEVVNIAEAIPQNQATAVVDINNGDSLTIQIPMPTTAAVPDNSQVRVVAPPAPVTRQEPAAQAQSQTQPAATASTATRPAATTATTTRSTTTANTARPAATTRSTGSTRAINDYWVQTGAFSSMVRAEDAKEMLNNKGLTSIIETSIVNGRNFFRVRLGPYTSENEAKHWLAIVQLIDGFHDSQVRQTIR